MLEFDMMKPVRLLFLALLLCLAAAPATAAPAGGDGEELDVNEMLIGHAADGFYVGFEPFTIVELPRIFLLHGPDGYGLKFYGSTAAALRSGDFTLELHGDDHGDEAAHGDEAHADEVPGEHGTDVALVEGETSAGVPADEATLNEWISAGEHLHAALVPLGGQEVALDLSITRHYLFGLLAALLCLLIFVPLGNRYKRGVGRDSAPRGGFQNAFETLVVFVRDEVAKPNLGHKYKKFLPYLLTAFFFILFGNLLGLVPYAGAPTSNLAVTGVLAFLTFIIGQLWASSEHWKHIFWPPGVPVLVKIILIPVEVMGLFTKHIALAIRLFANMVAGTLVIYSLIGLIFIVAATFGAGAGWGTAVASSLLTLFILAIKLLVAFIQAYVFTMLSALFIGMAVEEHHESAVEGPTPGEGSVHAHDQVTPHTISGDGEEARRATHVAEPAVA